jgi:hypothetical protein
MDPGRPKNQNFSNWMKPVPLCRDRRVDSTIYFFPKMDTYAKVIAF